MAESLHPRRLAATAALLAIAVAVTWLLTYDSRRASRAAAETAAGAFPWAVAWREDPVWYDGRAEIAEYRASRTIYGQPRAYLARVMLNKELCDPDTRTKAAPPYDGEIEVFKFHVREDIPTEAYTYHFSTMAYVATHDLSMVKLDMGSQEDCGATFKQLSFGQRGRGMRVDCLQHSYFPNEGTQHTSADVDRVTVMQDALPVVLRSFPFQDSDNFGRIVLGVIPDQTDTHLTRVEPVRYAVEYAGAETLDLPIGERRAHKISLTPLQRRADLPPMHYWFDADPATQHVMVKHEGPYGVKYELSSLTRDAYWAR